MAQRRHGRDLTEPRAAFTAALQRLRRRLPDMSDEVLARRASMTVLPSGRRVTVNARRLGEWLNGRSVPRDFEQVLAVVQAVDAVSGGTAAGLPPGPSTEQWRRLWRAAHEHRTVAGTPTTAGTGTAADLVVGRPPSDAAALRQRASMAAAIDAALRDDPVRQVLLTGPGGAGKSQLAAAAFHRARGGGGVYLWVPASSRQSVLTAYARAWRVIASEALDRPARPNGRQADLDRYGHDEETQADLLVAWLRSAPRPWLLVLDDVNDPAELDGLWPIGEQGRSIVTSRRRDAMVIRPAVRVITVGMFTPTESVDYLRSRLSLDPTVDQGDPVDDDLAKLAAALGHFPLALSQAAAFLIDSGTSLPEYRQLVDDQRERLSDLFPPSSPADGHDRTVATTWQLAAQRAATLAKPGTAQRMLELVAVLAPEGIPEAVLLTGAACQWVGGTRRDALLALRAVHRLSLVNHEATTVAMHALVQRAVREVVPDERLPRLARVAADALEEVWASAEGRQDLAAALYDSVEAVRRAVGEHLWAGGMHPVLRRIGEYLSRLGRAGAARKAVEKLLRQARSRLGDEHRDVVFLRAQAAQAMGELGDPGVAYAALERLRREAERLLGAEDPDTLAVRLHAAQQRYEAGAVAAALIDLVALVDEADTVLGADHSVTLTARGCLALCRGLSGDAIGAREGYAALVQDLTRHLGPRHPDTLNAMSDLGRWIGETGDPDLAVGTYVKAVEGLQDVAGRLHHDTLTARHNLAYWRGLAGQLPLAVEEFTVAAEDAERALGPRHPTSLTFRANLAYWRGLAGDPARGMTELADLRRTVDELLGSDHPRALRTRQQHAELRHRCGDTAGATGDLTATLADMRRIQGDDHPRTREVAELLTRWTAPSADGMG